MVLKLVMHRGTSTWMVGAIWDRRKAVRDSALFPLSFSE